MNLPPFPESYIPASPEERLRWVQWGEECARMGAEAEWRQIQNLTLMGNAMAHKLKKADPTSGWPAKWGEYVTTNGLSSPLRAIDAARSGGKGDGE